MEWEYKVSKIIVTIGVAIFWIIALINEDITFKVLGVCIFTGIAYLIGCLGTKVSMKMVGIGDKIANKVIRFLYYAFIFVCIVGISALMYWFILFIDDVREPATDLATALSEVIFLLFIFIAFVIVVFVPYIQTLIALLLRFIRRRKK